jgi:galactose mutarotase-like enzyme
MPKITQHPEALESIELHDEHGDARVMLAPERGGMLTRFTLAGVPVIYLDEATLHDRAQSVRGGIPILFPISGKLPNGQYTLGTGSSAATYAMKQHGFARNLPWRVCELSTSAAKSSSQPAEASITLALSSSELTRAQYPFDFELRFTYRLAAGTLTLEQTFENRGGEPMPVQPGLHPYFFVPDASKTSARIEVDATHAYDNTLGRDVVLDGPIALSGREVDLHLHDQRARTTLLRRPGLADVRIGFGSDQKVLVIWTLPGRDFVCIEPWSSRFGALADGSAPWVPPGGQLTTVLTISTEP